MYEGTRYNVQRRSPSGWRGFGVLLSPFMGEPEGALATWMSCVVGCALERPEVGVHGLLAAGKIALSDERSLVGIDPKTVYNYTKK